MGRLNVRFESRWFVIRQDEIVLGDPRVLPKSGQMDFTITPIVDFPSETTETIRPEPFETDDVLVTVYDPLVDTTADQLAFAGAVSASATANAAEGRVRPVLAAISVTGTSNQPNVSTSSNKQAFAGHVSVSCHN